MDNAIVRSKIVGKKEHPLNAPIMEFESTKEDCLPEVLGRRCSSIKKLEISDFCRQQIFLQQISGLKNMIPKQIMNLEEKYLRHCLEFIHLSAMRGNSCPVSTKVNLFSDGFSSRAVGGDALFLFSSGKENIAISSCVEDPIVGSITGSTSMKNILKSPLLLRQLGPDDDNINHGNPSAIQVRKSLCVGSLHSLDIQKKRVAPEDQIFKCEPLHKRLVSTSSTNSTFSDPSSLSSSSSSSSSSFASAYCHGMLHCSWNNGYPRYVFSVDQDQREIYTTNLSKVGSEYVYMYCRGGKRENEVDDVGLDVVGKMRVSNSFTVCNLGTEIMETEFIFYATGHDNEGDVQHTTDQRVKKSRGGLSKKVANIFPLSRQRRTKSKFDGWVGLQDNLLESESNEQGHLLPGSSSFPSNLELAAIVVKQHIPRTQNKLQAGGWGLKFLKEGGHIQKVAAPQLCRDHHSTSMDMDVVIPAGLHGGPTMKNGGLSSLVERWRSGGSCDCGGWDIGCPLTLLTALPNNKHVIHPAGVFGSNDSFQLFTQGCKQSLPVIEVTNIHDGLYYIHYQSTLSALQSLSIAVAIIHSHSPTLKPKKYIGN